MNLWESIKDFFSGSAEDLQNTVAEQVELPQNSEEVAKDAEAIANSVDEQINQNQDK